MKTTSLDEMPRLVWIPAPCPKCGAKTEAEAEIRCRPSTDWTGERYCDGEFEDGVSVQPTAESLAALDDWFVAHAAD